MKRNRTTDTGQMAADLIDALVHVRAALPADEQVGDAWATVETFCAIALRVFAKTNPSKIRSEAVTAELQTLIPKS